MEKLRHKSFEGQRNLTTYENMDKYRNLLQWFQIWRQASTSLFAYHHYRQHLTIRKQDPHRQLNTRGCEVSSPKRKQCTT